MLCIVHHCWNQLICLQGNTAANSFSWWQSLRKMHVYHNNFSSWLSTSCDVSTVKCPSKSKIFPWLRQQQGRACFDKHPLAKLTPNTGGFWTQPNAGASHINLLCKSRDEESTGRLLQFCFCTLVRTLSCYCYFISEHRASSHSLWI